MKHSQYIYYVVSVIVTGMMVVSCSIKRQTEEESGVVARIGDAALTEEDVVQMVPEGTNSEDSAKIVSSYVKRWATDILLYENARKNITNQKEIDRLVEEYRRSLTIHYYQQNMVNSKVEQPTDAEARLYYEQNLNDFRLDRSVAKGMILKIPKAAKGLKGVIKNIKKKNITSKIKRFDDKDMQQIEKYALQNAIYYNVFLDRWEYVEALQTRSGVDFNEPLDNGFCEIEDAETITIVRFVEYKAIGETAPEEMMIEEARQRLYSKRRLDYLRDFGSSLYEEAIEKGKVEIRQHTRRTEKEKTK